MSNLAAPPPGSNPPRFEAVTTLLLGAGFTISRLASRLAPDKTLLTARSAETVKSLSARYPLVERLSLEDQTELSALLSRSPGIKTVVDGVPPPEGVSSEKIFEAAKSRGALFAKSGITKLIYISTSGVYGGNDGSWVNETTAANPRFTRGKARLATEDGYREALQNKLTVVRVPAIYGPGRGIGTSLKSGRYRLIDGGTRWTNRIEVSDLASALLAASTLSALPPILCLSDGTPAQACDVVDFYCATFGLPKPKSISAEEAFAAGLETMLSNQRIDSSASWKALGIEPKFKQYKEGAFQEMGQEMSQKKRSNQPPKS